MNRITLFSRIYESYKSLNNCPRSCIKTLKYPMTNYLPTEYEIEEVSYIQFFHDIGIDLKIVLSYQFDKCKVVSDIDPSVISYELKDMILCPAQIFDETDITKLIEYHYDLSLLIHLL